jgi:hypothetical protein
LFKRGSNCQKTAINLGFITNLRYFYDFSVPLALLQPRLMKVRQKSHELRIKALNLSWMILESERYWNVPFVLSLRVYPDDTPISRELLQSSTLMVL